MLVGKITSIQFNQFRVKIFSNVRGGALNIQGEIYYFGNIGSYLKTSNPLGEEIICEVIAIFDTDKQDTEQNFDLNGNRELLLKPIGTYKNENFTLDIGVYPSLYSDVSLLTSKDLEKILMSTQEDEVKSESIYLGMSKNHINHPVSIQIDKFFGIHSAVLGNSGSGKSNTIAHLLQEIYKKEEFAVGSKIIIFDVNGEYSQAFWSLLIVWESNYLSPILKRLRMVLSRSICHISCFLLMNGVLFLMATDATQKPFWEKVLQEAYRFYKISTSTQMDERRQSIDYLRYRLYKSATNVMSQTDSDTSKVTTLKSVIARIKQLIDNFAPDDNQAQELMCDADKISQHCSINFGKQSEKLPTIIDDVGKKIKMSEINKILSIRNKGDMFFDPTFLQIATEIVLLDEEAMGNKITRGYVGTMLTRLDYFINNPECSFMCEMGSNDIKDTSKYLDYLWEESQLIIIDTGELGKYTLETLTSVIARPAFEYRKKQEGENRRKNPVHLVLDKAHRYIKKDQKYLLKDNVFERIAREGRKYSLYLLISSQRPSELSETVLSQCANFIIHRIQNENDMQHINAVLPYFSEDFVSKIK